MYNKTWLPTIYSPYKYKYYKDVPLQKFWRVGMPVCFFEILKAAAYHVSSVAG